MRILLACLTGLLLTVSACATQTEPTRFTESYSRGTALIKQMAGQAKPDGVNDWGCKPARGASYVVLIHGTFSSSMMSFGALAPRLGNSGYCVYAPDYGAREPSDLFKAVISVEQSAQQVADFIDVVMARTGADKIDLIGHSQGGLLGFYLLKELGYADRVRHFLAMAPSIRGTTIAPDDWKVQDRYCQACADQNPNSPIIRAVNEGPITQPGVQYTVLVTQQDYIVRPVESQFVREEGVRNLYIQDSLPDKFATHSNMLYDDEVLDLVVSLMAQPPSTMPSLTTQTCQSECSPR